MWCDTPRTVLTRYWHHPVWTLDFPFPESWS
jgi:hypothetical protein